MILVLFESNEHTVLKTGTILVRLDLRNSELGEFASNYKITVTRDESFRQYCTEQTHSIPLVLDLGCLPFLRGTNCRRYFAKTCQWSSEYPSTWNPEEGAEGMENC